jgi:hypothetical protein
MSAAGPSSSGGLADAESLALMRRLQEEDDAALAAQLMAQDTGRCIARCMCAEGSVCFLTVIRVFPDRAG